MVSDEMVKAALSAWTNSLSFDDLIAMRAALEAAEAVREREAEDVCEGCGKPAVGHSGDDVPLCRECGEELLSSSGATHD